MPRVKLNLTFFYLFAKLFWLYFDLMAHKKAGGSTRNGRDSNAQRLGVKKFGGEKVSAGSIIVRQRGSKMMAGDNVRLGKDYTLFATAPGEVRFSEQAKRKFNGQVHKKRVVSVVPA